MWNMLRFFMELNATTDTQQKKSLTLCDKVHKII